MNKIKIKKKTPSKKRAGGVVGGVGPEFKPQYRKKKWKEGRREGRKEGGREKLEVCDPGRKEGRKEKKRKKLEIWAQGSNSWSSKCQVQPLVPVCQIMRPGEGQRKEIYDIAPNVKLLDHIILF
jgi:hypothetical protein